jgi:hypothetical protein
VDRPKQLQSVLHVNGKNLPPHLLAVAPKHPGLWRVLDEISSWYDHQLRRQYCSWDSDAGVNSPKEIDPDAEL